ncbi:hypothetical protein DL764_009145 [Monosporascus ibericus]|uniref:Uncharacterized protein n=1 Tax=Monosporascus ibericus TaxID=155417 RepID=A0A4Q4SVN7_9PEZI|nr:hypothetical protein DL764_009145 [Monosporascus ibericus]
MSGTEIPRQITRLIGVIEDVIEAYDTINGLRGLPEAFQEVSRWLPLAEQTLREAKTPAKKVNSVDDANVLETYLNSCEEKADKLLEIFQKIDRKSKGEYVPSVYRSIAIKLGKHRVETLMNGILEDLGSLAAHHVFQAAMQQQVELLDKAKQELANVPPSLSDSDFDEQSGTANQFGDGNRMFNNFGGSQKNIEGGNYESGGGVMNIGNTPKTYRVIPLPRNEDVVNRVHIFTRLDALLPPTSEHQNAALCGLGGSGKTQVALEYAYRRCRDDPACSVFWVHADNETTFAQDYKAIAQRLGLDKLDGEKLLMAVRKRIENRPSWLLVLDNADDLALFGVGRVSHNTSHRQAEEPASLYDYVPRCATGTVLWTSRDERIVGTLVGPRRGIQVGRMDPGEAKELLETSRNEKVGSEEVIDAEKLLEELQWLPLAISQAGAYLRRTSTPIGEYLLKLAEGKERWRVLKATEFDRHRRRGVPNSVLETWSISIERIRLDNEMAYRIMHIIAYVNNQDIPFEIITAACLYDDGSKEKGSEENKNRIMEAVTRLKEFAFLGMRKEGKDVRSYEMHKLVQEATRYGLSMRSSEKEAYFSNGALQIMARLFPESKREAWAECEKYITHAVQVGEWADICKREVEVSGLLTRVSDYLYDRGRWREKEPVDMRAYELRREVLGEKHPDTIRSMADLATTYHQQGRYDKAEPIKIEALELRREVLGEKHPDTIWSMAELATTYNAQGRYDEAEPIKIEALELRREVLGEKHPDTLQAMHDLAITWKSRGRRNDAIALMDEWTYRQSFRKKVLILRSGVASLIPRVPSPTISIFPSGEKPSANRGWLEISLAVAYMEVQAVVKERRPLDVASGGNATSLREDLVKTCVICSNFNALLPGFDTSQQPMGSLIDEFARRVCIDTDISALVTENANGKYSFDQTNVVAKAEHLPTRGIFREEWALFAAVTGRLSPALAIPRLHPDLMADTYVPGPGQIKLFKDDPRGMAAIFKEMIKHWDAFSQALSDDDTMLRVIMTNHGSRHKAQGKEESEDLAWVQDLLVGQSPA